MNLIETLSSISGAGHVLCGADSDKYASDWTHKYTARPLAVVKPASTEEVSEIVKFCAATGTAVVPVSGNTGLNGGTYAKDAIMISMERMNRIRELRADARIAIVDAGVILSQLHDAAEAEGLVFPLTFGARGSAMIGGALSTNAGGSNVVRYGSTRGLCLGIEAVMPDGRIMDLMTELHKDNSGYDLKDLMIGAEGTLGLITGAVVKLFPKPLAYATAMVAVPKLDDALGLLNALQIETGGAVEAFEYMPRPYVARHVEIMEHGREPFDQEYDVNILVEIGATAPRDGALDDAGAVPAVELLENTLAQMMEEGSILDAVIAKSDTQRQEMWRRREDAAEVVLTKKPLVNNDICVPLDRVAEFDQRMEQKLSRIDPTCSALTVAHLGDGNIHYTLCPSNEGLEDELMEAVEDVALSLGGTFSAEHGVGLSKRNSMARRKDKVALDVMWTIKRALDPKGIMNPGKVLPDC